MNLDPARNLVVLDPLREAPQRARIELVARDGGDVGDHCLAKEAVGYAGGVAGVSHDRGCVFASRKSS